jgi:cell division protein FtsN
MRRAYGNKNLAQLKFFLYASEDYADKLDTVMSSGSSAPAMPLRSRGSWPTVDGSLEDDRSAGDPSGGGTLVELASGLGGDAEYDWDDTAEEPLLWAHTLDPAVEPPSGLPGPTLAAAARGARGPGVWRRATDACRGRHSRFEPTRCAGTGALAVVLGLAGLAVVAALWLTGYGQVKTAQESTVPAVAPAPATPIALPAQALPETVLEESVAGIDGSATLATKVPVAALARPAAAQPVTPVVATAEPRPAKPADVAPTAPVAQVEPPTEAPSRPAPPLSPVPAPDALSTAAPAPSLPKPSGNGSWAVVVDSYVEESDAERRRAQIERMSLPAEVRWFLVKDEIRYRVIVPGYSTQDAANTAAAELRRRKAGGAWVMRMPKQEQQAGNSP